MIYIMIIVSIFTALLGFHLGTYIEYVSPTFEKFKISWEAISAIGAILLPVALFILNDINKKREKEEQKRKDELALIKEHIDNDVILLISPLAPNVSKTRDTIFESCTKIAMELSSISAISSYYDSKILTIGKCMGIMSILLANNENISKELLYKTSKEICITVKFLYASLINDETYNDIIKILTELNDILEEELNNKPKRGNQ